MIIGKQIIGISYDTFKDAQQTSAGGALRVNLGRPNVGSLWQLDRIWFRSNAGTPITLRVYGAPNPLHIQPSDVLDFSPSIAENLADEFQPPIVRDNENLILDFTNGGATDLIYFRIDYRIGYLQAFQAPEAVTYPALPGVTVTPEQVRAAHDLQRAYARNNWPGSPS